MRVLLVLLIAVSAYAGDVQDKTPRMAAIEKTFGLRMAAVLSDGSMKKWVFVSPSTTITEFFPVLVPVNATDRQVELAKLAAQFCNWADEKAFENYLKTHHPDDSKDGAIYQ